MSGAVGSIRGRIIRLTATRTARNGRAFAVAIVTVWEARRKIETHWRVVLSGASLAAARMLEIGAPIVVSGEIYASICDHDGLRRPAFAMAARKLIPQDDPRPARSARRPATPIERAEAAFKPRQLEMSL